MHESWYDNELRLSILVRNESELLFYDHQLIMLFYLFILFGLDRFEYKSIRVISGSGLHRINKSPGQFGSYWILGQFGLLQFQIGSVLDRFNFKFRVEIGSTLPHVGSGLVSGHSIRVTFAKFDSSW